VTKHAPRSAAARNAAARPELRLLLLSRLREAESERDLSHHLDGGHAYLAVALRGVGVAHAEEAAVHPHGEVERSAGDQVLHVHVAAVLSRRHRAVRSGLVERHAHHPGNGESGTAMLRPGIGRAGRR